MTNTEVFLRGTFATFIQKVKSSLNIEFFGNIDDEDSFEHEVKNVKTDFLFFSLLGGISSLLYIFLPNVFGGYFTGTIVSILVTFALFVLKILLRTIDENMHGEDIRSELGEALPDILFISCLLMFIHYILGPLGLFLFCFGFLSYVQFWKMDKPREPYMEDKTKEVPIETYFNRLRHNVNKSPKKRVIKIASFFVIIAVQTCTYIEYIFKIGSFNNKTEEL